MKLERQTKPKEFEPIVITLTIETQEEAVILQQMVIVNLTIPEFMVNADIIHEQQKETVMKFLEALDDCLM